MSDAKPKLNKDEIVGLLQKSIELDTFENSLKRKVTQSIFEVAKSLGDTGLQEMALDLARNTVSVSFDDVTKFIEERFNDDMRAALEAKLGIS